MNRVNRSAAQSKKIVFPWEKELNPEQRSAVESIEGPLMILAGAGSGKTRVIAYRIAYLVASGTINADKILALTFTNKAAKEMRARVLQLINTNNNKLWFGTFHSIFARILRQEAGKIGFKKNYSIYDESNQVRAIKDVILKRNLPTGEYTPQELLKSISKLKSRLISPADYKISETNSIKQKVLSPVYGAYNDYLRSNNAMDFDDLLFYTYRLFKNNPDTLRLYQNRFRYMLVDEFQDTNIAQYQIIIQLVSKHNNICVVGDDDQSIYRWRGAEIKNILQFEHDFPNTKIVRLEQNYRSTENILKAANSVIKNNKIRHEKALWTDKGKGEKITLHLANSDYDEAQWITKSITASVSR
ncbi:UvrD-helicase domain-containing protein, partial [candidate division KSB1 bacterium]|nr:UvrD-helicase domain-containing protein [candidate division KSB1 bacterium]